MQNDHENCNCWECVKENHYSQLNDFANEDLETDSLEAEENDRIQFKNYGDGLVFTKPDGSKLIVKQPPKGHVVRATVVKNFGDVLLLNSGNKFPNDKTKFDIIDSKGSIGHQIVRDTQLFVTDNPLTNKTVAGAKVIADTTKNVIHGVEDVASTGFSIISFAGKNLKWILIALGILVAAYFGFQFYAAAKTATRG